MINLITLYFTASRRLTVKLVALLKRKRPIKKKEKKRSQGVPLFRYQDLPLRDRRQGWKQGQGAPRERGASCCVSHFQLILSGRSTCSTLSGVPSPWRHDPDKFSDRLPRYAGRNSIILSIYLLVSFFFNSKHYVEKSSRLDGF